MSLTVNETTIKNILDGLLLKRIPQNKSVEKTSSNFKNNSYTLFWMGGGNLSSQISNNFAYSNRFKLEVSYITKTEDERKLAGENFVSIVNAICQDDSFDGFGDDSFDFVQVDDEHCKGTLTFLFGIEVLV